ncbi:transformer-2 protein homolog beta-like isoform X3 [Ruditapes philippinarum]|uniref:transformer-2 protein homolog beta-like isoform X3 n=1 Tax=Ruditapes philippinarum TaxID=129788 RepID=UPI00295BCAF6|nr:transformer-2 protein homolog beta-like isoform X3 [Ruditapes philippinarum]XP_060606077.1 transformer-2 protein homolog beta-like isoform X3 [Ruditapes philippinarum]
MSENGDVASRSPSHHDSPAPSEGSRKKRSRSRSKSYSRSRSRSHSRHHRRRRSYSKSRSRSRSRRRSRSPKRSRRSRSRSRDRRSRDRPGRGRRDRTRSRSPMSSRRRHDGNRDDPEPSKCLGVFGLSLYTQERDLREVFGRYGEMEECNVVYDRQSGRSRGFAFVYYRNIDDSIEAKDRCSGLEIDGRRIRVDYSITRRAHTPTPGIYLGKPTSRSERYEGRDRYDDGYRGSYSRHRSPSPYRRRRHSYSRSRSRSYSPRRSYY